MAYPTYTLFAREVPLGMGGEAPNLLPQTTKLVLFNSRRNTVIDLLSTKCTPSVSGSSASYTAGVPRYAIARIGAASGGEMAATEVESDSASPLPAEIVCRVRPTYSGPMSIIARRAVAWAGTGDLILGKHYPRPGQAPALAAKGAVISGVLIREGEGIAIVGDPELDAALRHTGVGPLNIECTVADDATGKLTTYRAVGVAVASETPAFSINNEAGSGVVLRVVSVIVICTGFGSQSAFAEALAWYIADCMPIEANEGRSDITSSVVAHDSAAPLPSGIAAFRGEMEMLMARGKEWLAKAYVQGSFIPNVLQAPIMGEVKRRMVPLLRDPTRQMPITDCEPLSRMPWSIGPGQGIAIGCGVNLLNSSFGTCSGDPLEAVADVEITFRVRPRVARRIIGATSIRGVA